MSVEELLNKYFEGETSQAEEQWLRQQFAHGAVPGHLKEYAPFFAYFDDEKSKQTTPAAPTLARRGSHLRRWTYALGGVAACLCLALGANLLHNHRGVPANYVIIDGKRYTDTELVRTQAKVAFGDVRFTREELFESMFE